jgi:hypothetical protein
MTFRPFSNKLKADNNSRVLNITTLEDGKPIQVINGAVASALIGADQLDAAAVTAAKLAADAVETAKIKDLAVTADKLAANAVNGSKIEDRSIPADKLQVGTITATEIAGSTITEAKLAGSFSDSFLADNAVTSRVIADDAVLAEHLATDSVTSDAIAAGAVGESELADSSITQAKLNLATPTADHEAATKAYVDALLTGLHFLTPVSVKLNYALDGAPSGLADIDGQPVVADTRVFVLNADFPIQSGIYLAQSGTWTRAADFAVGKHVHSSYFFVNGGNVYGNTSWVCTNDDAADTVGTHPLAFSQMGGQGLYQAGAGLALDGNTFSIPTDGIAIGMIPSKLITGAKIADATVDSLQIKNDAITQDKLADLSVGTAELIDLSVTTGKLALEAVDSAQIKLGAVNTDQLHANAVTGAKMADGTITNLQVSASAAIAQSKISGLVDDLAAKLALAGGTMTGDITMSVGAVVKGLPNAPSANDEAASKKYVDDTVGAVDLTPYFKHDGTVAMTGELDAGTNKIVNVVNPTSAQDAATKDYVDGAVAAIDLTEYLKKDGTVAMTGALDLGNNLIQNVLDPASDQDAATKKYVDDAIAVIPVSEAVFAGALTIYVDSTNGTDAPNGGTLSAPYASINYAYSQVPSLGAPANNTYNANVGKFVTEKLILQLAPGRYSENVLLGFKRARVQLVGNGVQILGSVTMAAKLADFPASNMEALKASFPSPWTGTSAQMTFEIAGQAGGGVEADTTADPFVVTGLSTLLFDEPTVPGLAASGLAWDNYFGQFNFYANKANLIGGMVYSTSYVTTPFRGIGTNVLEVDSCTIGEASIPYRSYFGVVPYAYVANPTLWNTGTGVATNVPSTGAQTSTTLQDATKSWTVNQYAGATITLTGGTGAGQTRTVLSNTANTLTVSVAWATTPVAASTIYSLVGAANKVAEAVVTAKVNNTTMGATIGPRLTIGEIDGCRIYDIDRTMLGTVDNGAVTGTTSTSYIGMVVNQFRVYSGTGIPASQYRIGAATGTTRYKMDATSYTTLAFSRNSSGVLSARTLDAGGGVSFDFLDDSRSLAYTPTTGANWLDPDPSTVGAALDKVGALGLLAAAPANGQIPIGNGTGFSLNTLTGGTSISVTPGAGTVSISYFETNAVQSLTASGAVNVTTNVALLKTNGGITATIPAASAMSGKRLVVKKTNALAADTLEVSGGGTIDGAVSQSLFSYESLTLLSDGSAWYII